jgi:tetraacyldisaccharide 4'-kinase
MNVALASLARRLESDGARLPQLDFLASLWAKVSAPRVRRPMSLPDGVRVVGIGGPTLGGSGKSPLAVALARACAERGERVTLVGHGHRASIRRPRVVEPYDDVRGAGDDALFAAVELASVGVSVVVGPTRQLAIDFAARRRGWLVVDGLLQARPRPVARSLLVVDELSPWGSGRCPPSGDLKAPREALLAATDAVVPIGESSQGVRARLIRARDPAGAEVPLADLATTPFGFISTLARPARVLRSLALRGLRPSATLDFGDHARPSPAEVERAAGKKQRVKAWLATSKCVINLPPSIGGAPVLRLEHRLDLPKALVDWVLFEGSLPPVFCPSSLGQKAW